MDCAYDVFKIVLAGVVTGIIGYFVGRRLERAKQQDAREQARHDERLQALKRPSFGLVFDPKMSECVTLHSYSAGTALSRYAVTAEKAEYHDSYVSVLMANTGNVPITQCKAHITKLARKVGDADWENVPIGGALQLIWAFNAVVDSIPPHAARALNVLHVDARLKTVRLQVVGGMPVLLVPYLAAACDLEITITADAADAASNVITLCVQWNPESAGNWPAGALSAKEQMPFLI